MDNRCIAVVEGGIPETTELLKQKFEHVSISLHPQSLFESVFVSLTLYEYLFNYRIQIFYTGSPNVGKIIMAAAAPVSTSYLLFIFSSSSSLYLINER